MAKDKRVHFNLRRECKALPKPQTQGIYISSFFFFLGQIFGNFVMNLRRSFAPTMHKLMICICRIRGRISKWSASDKVA